MSDPFEEIMREQLDLEKLIGRTKLKEVPLTSPVTSYTPDYFGGTTPGVTTFSNRLAAYVRNGKVISCYGRMTWTAVTGTGLAQARILPIACNSTTSLRPTGALWINSFTFAGSWVEFLIPEGSTDAVLYTTTTNAVITALNIEAAADIAWNLSYFID